MLKSYSIESKIQEFLLLSINSIGNSLVILLDKFNGVNHMDIIYSIVTYGLIL